MSMGPELSPASDQSFVGAAAVQSGIPNKAPFPWLAMSTAPVPLPAVSSCHPQGAAVGQRESDIEQEAVSPKAEELDAILSMLMS